MPAAIPPSTVIVAAPSTVTVRAAAPAPSPSVVAGTYTTFVSWVGTSCLEIRYPTGTSKPVEMSCEPGQVQALHHIVTSAVDRIVGADPIMGQATVIACKVASDATGAVITSDSGTMGDGHHVNCIVGAP